MIAVALSGGVDSAVTAALLHQQGLPVIGVTARLMPLECHAVRGCCDEQKARELCAQLGIEHYIIDLSEEFQTQVIDRFLEDYSLGLTPNPCLPCNKLIKFGALLDKAQALGCETVATGHYVILAKYNGRWGVRRGTDPSKDQSYMLIGLSQEQLSRTMFPLGGMNKREVLDMAQTLGLPCTDRESQDVCFVPGEVTDYLKENLQLKPGPIIDLFGREIGRHRGLALYTIGQRRGLGLPAEDRMFVIEKQFATNTLIIGPRESLNNHEFTVSDVNWVSITPPVEPLECKVVVRYRGKPLQGTVKHLHRDMWAVDLEDNDQAIAPGQSAAFYDDDGWLLGGGEIGV